ncbi:MAG: LamG-like jellyroll fold domain-containing protein, partial [Bacteroidota bacterium]
MAFSWFLPTGNAFAQPTTPTITVGGTSTPTTTTLCAGENRALTAVSTAPNSGKALYCASEALTSSSAAGNYILLPSIDFTGITNFTVEFWFRADNTPLYTRIFVLGTLAELMVPGQTGAMYSQLTWAATLNTTSINYATTWTHVAITHDGTSVLYYLNGVLDKTYASTTKVSSLGSAAIRFGRKTADDGGAKCFKGWYDEIRIWKTTRTASQISTNYKNSISTSDVDYANLMAYYRLDETSGTTVVDASPNARNATLVNFTGTPWVNSPLTPFTSNNITYAWAGPSGTLSAASGAVVTATPTAVGANAYTATPTDAQGTAGTAATSTLTLNSNVAPTVSPSSYSGCANYATLTASGSGPWTWNTGATTQSINVTNSGSYWFSNGTCNSSAATVTLTPTSVAAPVVTSSTGTSVCLGSTSTLTASNSDAGAGNQLNFNLATAGQNYVDLPAATINTSRFTTGFTYEAWIKATTLADNTALFSMATNNGNYFSIELTSTLRIRVIMQNITGANNLALPTTPQVTGLGANNLFPTGTWVHVAITLDGTNTKLYINGNLAYTQANTKFPGNIGILTTNARLGEYSYNTAQSSFNGAMDEIRLWTVARSASEIASTINYSLPASTTGLLAYYKCNDGTGTTLTDASGNGINGTMVNFTGTVWAASTMTGTTGSFNPYTYSWAPSTGLSSTSGASVGASPAVPTTYTVTATSLGGCIAKTEYTLGINNLPAITSSPANASACAGAGSVNFSMAASNASTYKWQVSTDGGFVYNDISASGTYSNVTTTTLTVSSATLGMNGYKYRGVASGTCTPAVTSTAAQLLVSSSGTPSISISANTGTTICSGTSVIFTALVNQGGASPAIQWKLNGGNIATGATYTTSSLSNSDVVTAVLTSNSPCASPTTATSNSLTMTVAGPGGIAASVAISSSPAVVCANSVVTFTATPTGGGVSPAYVWKKNGTSVGTGSTYSISGLLGSDVISVEMTSSFSCATPAPATASTSLTINATPTVSPAGITTTCNTYVTLTASGTGPWLWNTGATTQSINALSAGNYWFTGAGCLSTTATVVFTAGTTASASVASSAGSAVCQGSTTTLTASNADAGAGYQLNFNTAISGTGQNVVVLPASAINSSKFTTGITYESWVKASAINDYTGLFSVATDEGNMFSIDLNTANNNRIRVWYQNAAGSSNLLLPATPQVTGLAANNLFPTNTWVHIAVTCDGSNSKLYINGSLAYTQANTKLPSNITTTTKASIGALNYNISRYSFTGAMDEMRIWTVARSAAEIAAYINIPVPAGTTGLLAYYKCNDGSGTTLTDASGNGNNGTLSNFTGTVWQTSTLTGTTGTGFNPYTYTWGPSTGLSSTSGASVVANMAGDVTYYATATNLLGCASVTAVPLTQSPATSVTTHPIAGSACVAGSTSFSVTAANATSYKWQVSTDGGAVYTDLSASSVYSNVATNTLSISNAIESMSGYKYRAAVTGTCSTVYSNPAQLSITVSGAPAITISSSIGTSVCSGSFVSFTASTNLGGSSPSIDWKVNGSTVYTGATYNNFSLTNGDVVTAVLTSNSACASPTTATSNALTFTVSGAVVPSVSISGTPSSVCTSTVVTFTATPTNGGTLPTYVWKKNGTSVGTGATYSTASLLSSDVISVEMTSSFACASPAVATANTSLTVASNPSVSPAGTTTSCANSVVLTASGSGPWLWNTGAVTQSINASSSGNYWFTSGGCVSSIATVVITTTSVATPAITSSAGSAVCFGSGTTLTAAVPAGSQLNFNSSAQGAGQNKVVLPTTLTNRKFDRGFTYEAWVKPTTVVDNSPVFSMALDGNFQVEVQVALNNRIRVSMTGATNNPVTIPTTPAIPGFGANNAVPANTWIHVAVTMDGANTKIYVNGSLITSAVNTLVPSNMNTGFVTTTAALGAASYTTTINAFNGAMDEVRLWNGARTATEIANNMNWSVPVNSPYLVAYYKMDEGSGTSVGDATGTYNSTSMTGFTGTVWQTTTLSTLNAYTYTWTPSAGLSATTGASVTATPASTTTYYATANNSNSCGAQVAFPLTVNVPPVITTNPAATTACDGGAATFTAVGNSATSYTWQLSTDNGSNFNTISAGGVYSTVTASTLTLTGVTAAMHGYQYRALANGLCSPSATSTAATLSITSLATPGISISSNIGTTLCTGTTATFTATTTLGGTSPFIQWKVDGSNVATGPSYTNSSLSNGQVVTAVLTSNSACASPTTVTSNSLTMTVAAAGGIAASVAISSSPSLICPNQPASFTAVPTNGGASPSYIWKVNGTNVGTGPTYVSASIPASAAVTCSMTSSFSCATPLPAVSNTLTAQGTPPIPTPVVVSPTGSTTVCAGSQTFTATIGSAGASPAYLWKKNGSTVATTATYTASSLSASDVITVTVTPSESCGTAVTSSNFTIAAVTALPPAATIGSSGPTSFCVGGSTTLSAVGLSQGPGNMLNFASNTYNVNYVKLPDNINLNAVTGFTYEVWVKPTSGSFGYNRLLTIGSNPNLGGYFDFGFNNTNVLYSEGGSLGGNIPAGAGTLTADAWSHVAITMDGTNIKLYINGALISSSACTGLPASMGSRNFILLGHGREGDGGSHAFQGNMDEARLWSIARTQSEIQANMYASPLPATSGLFAHYKFDEASGSTAADASGNGNTATLVNWGSSNFVTGTLTSLNPYTLTWSPADGLSATTGNSVVATPTATTTYSLTVTNAGGCSNVITQALTISSPPAITLQPLARSVCANESTSFSVSATGSGTLTYQWQIRNGAGSWSNVSNGGTSPAYSGATSATLSMATAPGSFTDNSFRCIVSGSCTPAATSNAALLEMNSASAASVSISADLGTTVCNAEQVTLTATPLNGGNAPTYKWYLNGSEVPGQTAASYTTPAISVSGTNVYCELTSSSSCATLGVVTSNTLTFTTTGSLTSSVSLIGSSSPVCPATPVTFTAAATSNGGNAPLYQFKVNGSNVGTNSTVNTYTTSSLLAGDIVTVLLTPSRGCASASTSSGITVSPAAVTVAVTVISNISGSTCGSSAIYTANITNGGVSPALQWYKNGSLVSGQTATTYTDAAATAGDDIYVVMSPAGTCYAGSLTSSTYILRGLNPVPAAPVLSASPVNCNGGAVTRTVLNPFVGNMLEFPSAAVADNFIMLPNNINQACSTGFTFEAWVNTSAAANFYSRIFGFGVSNAGANRIEMLMNMANENRIGVESYLLAGGNMNGNTTTYSINTWVHVAMTMDGTNMKLYQNGVLVDTKACATYPSTLGATAFNVIARSVDNVANSFRGHMDEIRMWTVARTQSQISGTMNQSIDVAASGLLLYYKLDQASGNTVRDLSGHGNNGTLTGYAALTDADKWKTTTNTAFDVPTVSWSPSIGLSATTGLSVSANPASSTTYTVTVTNAAGCSASGADVVTVSNAAVTPTGTQSACGSLVLSATGPAPWNWSNGANTQTITVTSDGTYSYTTSGGCISNAVAVTISSTPAVTAQPSGTAICTGGSAGFSATATGSPLSWQWQVSTDNGSTYSDISNTGIYTNATTSTLSLTGATTAVTGYKYRARVLNDCQTVYCNAAALTVYPTGTWLGGNIEWGVGANWCGGIPTASTDVVIPAIAANMPIIQSGLSATCNNLTVSNGATLSMFGVCQTNVHGDLTVNGTLTGTGSDSLRIGGNIYNNGLVTLTKPTVLYGSAKVISGNADSLIISSLRLDGTYTTDLGKFKLGSNTSGVGTLTLGVNDQLYITGSYPAFNIVATGMNSRIVMT